MKFYNISNHPSVHWGEKQIREAKKLVEEGEIIDIPFPNVPPSATSEEVRAIADKVVAKVEPFDYDDKRNVKGRNVAMVMGEFSCTFAIISSLLEKGFSVVVATTERKVEFNEGKKIVKFSFVQFREIKKEERS